MQKNNQIQKVFQIKTNDINTKKTFFIKVSESIWNLGNWKTPEVCVAQNKNSGEMLTFLHFFFMNILTWYTGKCVSHVEQYK